MKIKLGQKLKNGYAIVLLLALVAVGAGTYYVYHLLNTKPTIILSPVMNPANSNLIDHASSAL